MKRLRWRLLEEAERATAGDVVDFSEFALPRSEPDAVERGGAAVLLPPDGGAWWGSVAAAAPLVVLDRVETPVQATDLAGRLGPRAAVAVRLRTGRGLHHAEEIVAALAAALPGRLRGLWYALADLVVDFDDQPRDLYFYDAGEGRAGSPGWLRSRCLTIARAHGLELWGQADVTFAEPPSPAELDRCLRLAALSGFDVIVGTDAACAWMDREEGRP